MSQAHCEICTREAHVSGRCYDPEHKAPHPLCVMHAYNVYLVESPSKIFWARNAASDFEPALNMRERLLN